MFTSRWPLLLLSLSLWMATTVSRANELSTTAFRFSDIKGMNIENFNREKIGQVEDLVYDSHSGDIRYAAVSFGGLLGVGEKLFAFPWKQLDLQYDTVNRHHRFLMNVDKTTLQNAPGFDAKNWPDVADPRWAADVDKIHGVTTHENDGVAARMSHLVGMAVKNGSDEDLGKVENVVVDMPKGKIRYAALSFGGFLGVGDKLFAVPFDMLRSQRDAKTKQYHIVLHVEKPALEKAPGFDKKSWPDFADANWADKVESFYHENLKRGSTPGATAMKSADLVGLKVENTKQEELGNVEALVVELKSGRIRYAAISFGGFLGLGDKLFAVPWDALAVRYDSKREANCLVLDADKSRLEKVIGFDKDHWPNFADARWANDVHTFFGLKQTEDIAGYMPVRKTADILGMPVRNPQGEDLGKIYELVINLHGGTVRYAALSSGGMLGIGSKLFAVPYRQIGFRNDPNTKDFVATIEVDKRQLDTAPTFDKEHWPDFADPNLARDIDRHYGEQTARPSGARAK